MMSAIKTTKGETISTQQMIWKKEQQRYSENTGKELME